MSKPMLEDARAVAAVVLAAQRLLEKIDNLTTDDFSKGGERQEREALRAALKKLTA